MSLAKICTVLKWMQYLIMTAQRKGICSELCTVQCWNNFGFGQGFGGYAPGTGQPPFYGYDYGYGFSQVSDASGINIEDLARAVGVPKNAITDLVRSVGTYNRTAKDYPNVYNTRVGSATNLRPVTSIRNKSGPVVIVGRAGLSEMNSNLTQNTISKSSTIVKKLNKTRRSLTDDDDAFFFGNTEGTCSTPDNRVGICINIRRCEPLLEMLKNLKTNPGAYSYLRGSLCDYDGLDPVVCCPFDKSPVTPKPSPQFYYLPGIDENCGVNNGSFTRRVVNGIPALLGEFPWIAALGYRSKRTPGKTNYQCGGTLITSRHVITAAHCIFGHEDDLYTVRLGELDLERDDDGANPVNVNVEKYIVHEEYNPVQHTNDIGLLKLVEDVEFNALLSPICLPKTPELRINNFEKTMPFIAGWGSTSYRGPSSQKLLEAQIPVVPNTKCVDAYSRFKNQVIDQRVLCAGYAQGGKDACQGDSGGPLMYPVIAPGQDIIRYYLIGVVSFGFRCAEPGYPGVYTRVTEFLPWIENNLNN